MAEKIPAVVHVDDTGRIQTVNKFVNFKFHQLISEFKKITGVPVLLNTSFNLNNEPIVMTPQDAIRSFYTCGMDILVIGNYIIKKSSMICIVPARKNSKGLKFKNRKKINNLSLVNNALTSALKSKEIKSIILTTDDDYLIKNSIKSKRIIIDKRPSRLAKDSTKRFKRLFVLYQKI